MPVIVYDFSDVIAFGAERSSLGPITERAAARLGVSVSPDPLPEQNLFVRSDHYNFVRRGIPSVFLMTGFSSPDPRWDEGEGFMGFLNTHYHRQSDEPDSDEEMEILYDQGAKFANINFLIAREIANNDDAPVWNEGDYFGEYFGNAR
jgi:Zn-dependent M28 family amino/carboxypeptidase